MLEILVYLLSTIIVWLAGNFILKIFFQMIQKGEALDIVFGWQKMLEKLYGGNQFKQLLGKALGDCEKCFAFWFMPLWFSVYYFLSTQILGLWITDFMHSYSTGKWFFINTLWYCIFHSVGATSGLWVLLLKNKKNGL